MSKLISIFVLAFSLQLSALAGTAVVTILDNQQNPLSGVKCIVSAMDYPQPVSGGVAVLWRTNYTTDIGGTFIISNAVPSEYMVTPVGNNFTTFTFIVFATNGTIYAGNTLLCNPPTSLALSQGNGPRIAYCYSQSNSVYQPWEFNPALGTDYVQQAINYLPVSTNRTQPGGGTVVFGPGVHPIYKTLIIPNNTNPYTLNLVGPGMTAGGITLFGSDSQSALVVGNGYATVSFFMRGLWLATAANNLTNILTIYNFGRIAIEDCWFGCWPAMIGNQDTYGLAGLTTPSTGILLYPDSDNFAEMFHGNLIPIYVDGNGSDLIVISRCHFSFVNGIDFRPDHGTVEDCFFSFCGIWNDWPSTSKYSLGADVYVSGGNPNHNLAFLKNYHYGCKARYYLDHDSGNPSETISFCDGSEATAYGTLCSAPANSVWTDVNLLNEANAGIPLNAEVVIANGVYSISDTNSPNVRTVDFTHRGPATFSQGLDLTKSVNLTFTNAAGKAFGLVVNSTTNGFTFVPK